MADASNGDGDSIDSSNPSNPKPNQASPDLPLASSPSTSASIEEIARQFQESISLPKKHPFWETQPVGQFIEIGDSTLPEGPIEAPTPLSEVKPEGYNLPAAYEWTTCDIDDDAAAAEAFLKKMKRFLGDAGVV